MPYAQFSKYTFLRSRNRFTAFFALISVLTGVSVYAQTASISGDEVPLDAHQYVVNNMWNLASDPAGTQSVTVNSSTSWSASYNWPKIQPLAVRGYPSVVLGWQFSKMPSGTGLPVAVSSKRPINCTVMFSVTGSACEDIAYDCWFHDTANPSSTTKPTDELMIWLSEFNGPQPIGSLIGTAYIDHHEWDLYEGWSDMGWEVHTFENHGGKLSNAALNLADFNHYLAENKYISSRPLLDTRFLTGIEFGVEVVWGTGVLDVTKYTCKVGRH
jgi:hypothetical protein